MKKTRMIECGTCGARRRVVDGQALRKLRLRSGITLRNLAAKLGLSPTYLSFLETNLKPSNDSLVVGYLRNCV